MPDNENPMQQPSWLDRLNQILGREPKNREQLVRLLRNLAKKKLLDPDALGMIEGVLQVSETQVRDIMVPRGQMIVVEQDATPAELLPTVIKSKHSRFPVIGENRDEIVGILLAKDLLRFAFNVEENFEIQNTMRPAAFIPESKRLNVLLREFRATRNHMAIVLDEYGNISGLVTIEDVLEQIVGEIEDEYDLEELTHIKKISNTEYNVKALTSINDFNEYFKTNFSDREVDTIGGLVLQRFGHLPKRGESVTIKKINFKVLHSNNRRIRLLQVTLPKKSRKKTANLITDLPQ